MKLLLTIFLGIFIMTCLLMIWPPKELDPTHLKEYQIEVINNDSLRLYQWDRFIGEVPLDKGISGIEGLINADIK